MLCSLRLLGGVAAIALLHLLEVILFGLEIEGHRTRKWQERQATLFELLEALSRVGLRLVDTVELDAVAGRSDVQVPVPCAADISRLGL